MARFFLCITFGCAVLVLTAETRTFHVSDVTLYFHLTNLAEEKEPYVFQENVIFTYQTQEAIRGIAVTFAHEHFQNRYVLAKSPKKHTMYYVAIPIHLFPDTEIEYQYIVDGVRIADPANPSVKLHKNGLRLSLARIQKQEALPHLLRSSPYTSFSIDFADSSSSETRTIFDYSYALHKRSPAYVSLVGNFNGWEVFFNPLERKSNDLFTTDITLAPGIVHYYYFVDGERILDPNNPRIAFDAIRGHMVSVLQIP